MTTYAVTGSTGHFGQNAIKQLLKLAPNDQIIALARNTKKAEELFPKEVRILPGDYTNPQQLEESLTGVDKLLFVSSQPGGLVTRQVQHQNIVTAAKNAGVKYIAYTSFYHADRATAPLADDHKATEKMIKNSGLKYSFLRNNWYLENDADKIKAAVNHQDFVYAAGDGRVGWALEDEYSEAAARVLVMKDTKEIYEFAGNPRTYQELAQNIVTKFKIVSLSIEDLRHALKDSGMDEAVIEIVVSIQELIRDGNLDGDSDDLPNVLGRPLTALPEAIKSVINEK
ncbi:SDR family oxidoreductase [Companilactobacillus sp. HBUAS59544]|uniref:SDR family oxidoreductase n=1 Tax=Companilactobacillus sp. HBUAS59544 TaxID=3109363 RepID=UPI002FF2D29D